MRKKLDVQNSYDEEMKYGVLVVFIWLLAIFIWIFASGTCGW